MSWTKFAEVDGLTRALRFVNKKPKFRIKIELLQICHVDSTRQFVMRVFFFYGTNGDVAPLITRIVKQISAFDAKVNIC